MSNPIATIIMDDGRIMKAELYPEIAPETVRNFIELANDRNFYDGLIFHRCISNFMIQGGCPNGNGMGGPGHTIKGEFDINGHPNSLSHQPGVLSMARAQDPNSAGSQFFICVADDSFLDGQYAAFGKLTDGLDVAEKISKVRTNFNDKPVEKQVIKSIRVE